VRGQLFFTPTAIGIVGFDVDTGWAATYCAESLGAEWADALSTVDVGGLKGTDADGGSNRPGIEIGKCKTMRVCLLILVRIYA